MLSQMKSNFPHRINRDGSYDSICSVCLITIACVRDEEELQQHEHSHVCNPMRLSQLGQHSSRSQLKDVLR
jgi:hypothetical protein